jgi:hypothetical protein
MLILSSLPPDSLELVELVITQALTLQVAQDLRDKEK